MIEENETQETSLKDLIDLVERDDLPTNEFSIQDTDPMVILGKLNEVIAYLQTLQNTINSSDSKANEALQKAIQAVADASQALSVANGIDAKATQALANAVEAVSTANSALSASNTALNTANTAISTANSALSSANNAVETAEDALGTASRAENKADTAITTANGAKTTAEGIDAKATTALENSQTAISTANSANATAQEALSQVVTGQGTKVYRDSQLLISLDIKPIEDNIADNATAINNEATTRANAINALDNAKVDKVAGKQLSTEDFTTAEKNKLAGLNNYDDTQVQADITALESAIPTKTSQLTNDSGYLTQHQDISGKADKNNSSQSITAGTITANTGDFININNSLTNIVTSLNKRAIIELIHANNTYSQSTFSIPSGKNFSDYSVLYFVFYSSGSSKYHCNAIPYQVFRDYKNFEIKDSTPNTDRYMQFNYVSDTQYSIGHNFYIEFRAIYGLKI